MITAYVGYISTANQLTENPVFKFCSSQNGVVVGLTTRSDCGWGRCYTLFGSVLVGVLLLSTSVQYICRTGLYKHTGGRDDDGIEAESSMTRSHAEV